MQGDARAAIDPSNGVLAVSAFLSCLQQSCIACVQYEAHAAGKAQSSTMLNALVT